MLPVRIQSKIMPVPDGCWLWTGEINRNGYGRAWHKGKKVVAHRVVYELLVGPIVNETLDHTCEQPACVNPAHLEQMSMKKNILKGDGPPAVNARKSHCKHGHPLSGDNLLVRKDNGYRQCKTCARIRYRHWAIRQGDTDE